AHHLVPSRLEEPDFDRAVRRPALPPLPEANERFLGDVVRPILVAPQRPAVPEGPGPEQLDEEIEGGNVIRADPLHDLVLVVARTALFIAHWGVGRQPGALGSSVLHIRREGAAWQLRRDLDFRDYWLEHPHRLDPVGRESNPSRMSAGRGRTSALDRERASWEERRKPRNRADFRAPSCSMPAA